MKTQNTDLIHCDLAEVRELLAALKSGRLNIVLPIKGNESLEYHITRLLLDIGVSPNLRGYCYIKTGIRLCVEERSIMESVTKCLYPEIARQFGTTASRVEHAIRHAITKAWERENLQMQLFFFGRSLGDKMRPTNASFIATLADHIYLQRKEHISYKSYK